LPHSRSIEDIAEDPTHNLSTWQRFSCLVLLILLLISTILLFRVRDVDNIICRRTLGVVPYSSLFIGTIWTDDVFIYGVFFVDNISIVII
jgi:hypothetical protein